MKELKKHSNSGLTLVEVLIATSIILVFLLVLIGVHNFYLKMAFSNGEIIKATELAEESLEIARFLRDSSWNANIAPLSLDTDYYLNFSAGSWQVTTTQVLVDNTFERKVKFSAVYRNVSGDIVSSGGIIDPDTLLVISTVSWSNKGATTTKSISTYLANLLDN